MVLTGDCREDDRKGGRGREREREMEDIIFNKRNVQIIFEGR